MSSPKEEEGVTFACQRCCQPLQMHSTFGNIEEDVLREFTGRGARELAFESRRGKSSGKEYEAGFKGNSGVESGSNGNGFLVIGETGMLSMPSSSSSPILSEDPPEADLNYKLKVTSRLFDILSDQSEVDHPLCEECADVIIDQMDYKLRTLEDECKDYREFLESLEKSRVGAEFEGEEEKAVKELRIQVEELEREEAELIRELDQLDQQQKEIEGQVVKQEEELKAMTEEENRYWYEYNNLKRTCFQCEDEYQSVSNQLRYSQAQLDRLKRTNVFNATFHIWHSGHFGTINGFRLGRLPTVSVEWSEINAAWGQAVLLLYCLAKKMDLTFKRFKLVPYGNHSFLESLEDKSRELPLYGSGGFRFLWNTKFDSAMVAFLDCLQQFKEEVERGDSGFCLPYKMEKGKIEDTKTGYSFSIKIQFNSEEHWTKALKYMLTNLKWALAWVSSQFPNQ